jgi:hypothetical protein
MVGVDSVHHSLGTALDLLRVLLAACQLEKFEYSKFKLASEGPATI